MGFIRAPKAILQLVSIFLIGLTQLFKEAQGTQYVTLRKISYVTYSNRHSLNGVEEGCAFLLNSEFSRFLCVFLTIFGKKLSNYSCVYSWCKLCTFYGNI